MESSGVGVLVGVIAATLYVLFVLLRHRRSGLPEALRRSFLTYTPQQLLENSHPSDVATVMRRGGRRELFLVEGGEYDGVVLAVRPVRGEDDRFDVVFLGTDGVLAVPPGIPDDGTASLGKLVIATRALQLRLIAPSPLADAIWSSRLRYWGEI